MTNAVSLLPSAAVVVAHGPTGATLTALNQIPALLGDHGKVIVIAGTEPGMTAVERASERGYSVVEDHGPDALAKLLSSLDGPVLVAHDDVTVSRHSVAGMVLAHARTGLTVVPATGRRVAQREIDHTELVCVVGDPTALAELAAESGFGPGRTVTGRFVAAADTEMSHSGDCRTRLVERWGAADAPLLVAGLIVRDEAENLPDCLASLAGVVDRIHVADTGSMDDTVSIARQHGADVIEIGWREDFAWARNQVLDQCRDATYMLWIDADERFVCADPKQFRQRIETFARLYPAYQLEIRNLADGVETHRFAAVRIASPSGLAFEGALHERPRRVDGSDLIEVGLSQCHIEHHGYVRDVLTTRDKLERNLRIARQSFENDPSGERAIHYARALVAATTDPAATLRELEPLLELAEDVPAPVAAMMHGLQAKLFLEAGDAAAAAERARAAVELVPADAIAGAVLAEALVRLGRPGAAIEEVVGLADRDSPEPIIIDHIAAQTRARALFDAALQTDQREVAIDMLDQLPEGFDPWPPFAQRFPIDALVSLAAASGARNDERLLQALALRPEVTAAQMAEARDQFLAAGGTLASADIIDGALADLSEVDRASALREEFASSGEPAAAAAYAGALASGHLDLTLEVEGVHDHPHGAAIALGVAAEALRRRDRHEEATAEAIEAAQLWPGALRAAAIVARAAIDNGMPEVALEMVEAARQSESDRPVSNARRHELTNRAVEAHLAMGDLPRAVSEALVVIEDRGRLESWAALLESTIDDTEKLTLVLGLGLLSDGTDFLAAAAATLRPDKTAELCVAYVMSGGLNPGAISTGILAANLRGRDDLADLLADHGDRLDVDVRVKLAAQLRASGAGAVADKLEQSALRLQR